MKIISTLLLLFATFILHAQDKKFPDDFLGAYKGKLEVFNPKGTQEYNMEFYFEKTDTIGRYRYTIVYNGEPRNYLLIEKDKAQGKYIIDENNGIVLQASVFGQNIYSIFEVMGNLITTTEHFYDDYMDFEIMMSRTSQIETTGKGTDEIPEVKVYPVIVTQRARLYKE